MIVYGTERGWRLCPLCEIPFKNVVEHLNKQHHMIDEELDQYRLIALKGYTKKQRAKNKENLLSARLKVIIL